MTAMFVTGRLWSPLDEFHSMPGISWFLEWPLGNFGWCSLEKHVVKGYVATVIRIIWYSANRSFVNKIRRLQKYSVQLEWSQSWLPMAFLRAFLHVLTGASAQPFWWGEGGSGCCKLPVHAFLCTKCLNLQLIQSTHHLMELFLSTNELCTIICHHQRRLTSKNLQELHH